MPRLLTNLEIKEVSSVDRGAGKGVRVLMTKRDQSTVDKALKLAIGSVLADGGKADAFIDLFKSFHEYLGKQEPEMTNEEIAKLVSESVAKAMEEVAKKKPPMDDNDDSGANDDNDSADKLGKAGLGAARGKQQRRDPKGGVGSNSPRSEGDAPDQTGDNDSAENASKADVEKAHDKITKALIGENAELKKKLNAIEEVAKRVEFGKRAVEIGLVEEDGEMLLKVHRGDPEALKKFEDKFKALSAQVAKGDLFKVIGGDGSAPGSAHDELVAKAAELRKAEPKLTAEQAYTKAVEQFPDIAKREAAERHARIQKFAA